jgi:hypothetical protein
MKLDDVVAVVGAYRVQTVGASSHRELWVPAAELADFNANIVGLIEVIAEFKPETTA